MKKRILFLLIALSLIAVPLYAEDLSTGTGQVLNDSKVIKLKISGSGIPLANPAVGAYKILTFYEGTGNIGKVSGQDMAFYDQMFFNENGFAVLRALEGQISLRMETNGEVLLAVYDPSEDGWVQITDPLTYACIWEQTCTGKIVGGTGQFAGQKGTWKIFAKGMGVYFNTSGQPANAVVHTLSGILELHLTD